VNSCIHGNVSQNLREPFLETCTANEGESECSSNCTQWEDNSAITKVPWWVSGPNYTFRSATITAIPTVYLESLQPFVSSQALIIWIIQVATTLLVAGLCLTFLISGQTLFTSTRSLFMAHWLDPHDHHQALWWRVNVPTLLILNVDPQHQKCMV